MIPKLPENIDFNVLNAAVTPFKTSVSSDVIRWFNSKQINLVDKVLPVYRGSFVGEKVYLESNALKFIVSPPSVEQISNALIEQGAEDLTYTENSVSCVFPFIEGDNTATVSFVDGEISIETGSAFIEDIIFEIVSK